MGNSQSTTPQPAPAESSCDFEAALAAYGPCENASKLKSNPSMKPSELVQLDSGFWRRTWKCRRCQAIIWSTIDDEARVREGFIRFFTRSHQKNGTFHCIICFDRPGLFPGVLDGTALDAIQSDCHKFMDHLSKDHFDIKFHEY